MKPPDKIIFMPLARGTPETHFRKMRSAVFAGLSQWLATALAAGKPVPLPEPLNGFGANIYILNGALVGTVFSINGGGPISDPPTKVTPLATFGVAPTATQSGPLWQLLCGHPDAMLRPGIAQPTAPWCGVIVHQGLIWNPQSLPWLTDFERAVAWMWLDTTYEAPNGLAMGPLQHLGVLHRGSSRLH